MKEPPLREERFLEEVRRQAERAGARRELSFCQGLSLVSAVGWMVSLPAVLGALGGRWLDQWRGSGVFWTLVLLSTGLVLGCASAWRHVKRESER